MISSTRVDLIEYRLRAKQVIQKLKQEHEGKWEIILIAMETAVQSGEREYPVALSKQWVEGTDWVVVIVGWHYGTITDEDGVDGIGVTEWEYRHATSLNKERIFVFLAGDPNTANAYRELQNQASLMEWVVKGNEANLSKVRKFRQELGKQYAGYFRNIDDFAEQLEQGLRKAIVEKVPVIPAHGGLAKVILKVRPEFKACIKSIQSLAFCKDIHDALHILRQDVIKSIRRILDAWRTENGRLSRTNERAIWALRVQAATQLSRIDTARKGLDESTAIDLLEYIGKLLNASDFLAPFGTSSEEEDGDANEATLDSFAERVDIFAGLAQRSFSEANSKMNEQKVAFDALHDSLRDRLDESRDEQSLTGDELTTLLEETKKMKANKTRLVDAVSLHSNWQTIHDAMEERRRCEFLRDYRTRLSRLVRSSIEPLARGDSSDAGLLKELDRLRQELQKENPEEDAFDCLRDKFDICFFDIDKRTKEILGIILRRVHEFDALLDKLDRSPASTGIVAVGSLQP